MICDEIQTGFGRLGDAYWGSQLKEIDVVPDIMIVSKALGNGTFPISGVLVKRNIAEAVANEKIWMSTYANHPTAAAVGREVIKIVDET